MFTDVPIVMKSLLDDVVLPSRIFDQNFGMGMFPDDFDRCCSFVTPFSRSYYRPWRHVRGRDSGVSNIATTNDEFKVNLDVQQFKPDQLSVKVIDNSVVVEGNHEERQDEHGFISRQFRRRYLLPQSVDPKSVVSSLSSDGVLTVSAPKKLPVNEFQVPIIQTNQPSLPIKQGEKQKNEEEPMES